MSCRTLPAHGTLTALDARQRARYTPAADYSGADLAVYKVSDAGGASASVRVSIRVRSACGGLATTRRGTAGPDTITGTGGRDVIAGLGGNDRITGLAGDDAICGGSGDDLLGGGAGSDRLFGSTGADKLGGSAGRDALDGGPGTSDICDGGDGRDRAAACERERRVP